MTFLPAVEEDIEPVFQLNKELMHRYEDLTAIHYEKVLAWVRDNIRQQLPYFRRVLVNGQTAGYFCLFPSEGRWELDSFFILPEFQNRGIGTEVLRHCLTQSEGNLFLYVFKANAGALRLYRRMGFRICNEVRKTAYILEYEKQGC